jgi:hypothetical protein
MLPDISLICPDCRERFVYLRHTKEDWDQRSAEEKAQIKEAVIEEKIQHAADPDCLMLEKFTKIEDHLSVIKGILVFFTVLAVFGMFIKSVR